MAAAIAMVESGGNTNATNIVTAPGPGRMPEQSYGLWQINVLSSPQYSASSLFNPTYNARAALAISSGGTNWNPWYISLHSGAYKKFLPPGYGTSSNRGQLITLGILLVGAGVAWGVHKDVIRLPKIRVPRLLRMV